MFKLPSYYGDFLMSNSTPDSLPSFSSSFSKSFDSRSGQLRGQVVRKTTVEFPESRILLPKTVLAVGLLNADLWQQFDRYFNEMTINKIGRRMFPYLQVDLRNLNPQTVYSVFLDFPLSDQHIWKYSRLGWTWNKNVDVKYCQMPPSFVEHPNSPNTGEFWTRKDGIDFKLVKFSNEESCRSRSNCVLLRSYHRYQPRVNLVQMDKTTGQPRWETLLRHSFPETSFVVVSTYMNPKISELKIFHNPYARAFKTESVTLSVASPDSTDQLGERNLPSICTPVEKWLPVPAKRSTSRDEGPESKKLKLQDSCPGSSSDSFVSSSTSFSESSSSSSFSEQTPDS